jgi:protein O-GlcNAc transferase
MNVDSEFERAVALHRNGAIADAEALCRAILAEAPQHPRALHLLGVIRFAGGDTVTAIDLVQRALSARPDYADAEFNLGVMTAAAGRLAEALEHFTHVAAARPDHADAHIRRGAMLMALSRFDEAEPAFRRALELRPEDGLILADLSSVALARRDIAAAVDYGRRAVARLPDAAELHLRLGQALAQTGEFDEALRCFRHAVELAPQSVAALMDLASALVGWGEADEGIDIFRRAICLTPGDVELHRRLLGALLYSPTATLDERFAAAEDFGRAAAARLPTTLPSLTNDQEPERKLRIGWLTSDLRDHPVARNLEPLFAHRDHARFEHFIYAEVSRPDAATEWFRAQAAGWRSTLGLSDGEVADLIRSDRIDIMVYLAGRFDRNRPQIAAWRPAPIQVSFHDPATSGLATMNYLIADPILVPRRSPERFVERVVRLPNFIVQPPISWTAPPVPPPSTASGHVTFGSFNNPAKLNHAVLATWGEILRRVPNSRLILKYRRQFASAELRDRISRELGQDLAARVDFDVSDRPMAEHLQAYETVDIALDPFPFTGSTTTFEALWMGVPVVTLAGDQMVGRWSTAMLTQAGASDLSARTLDEYVQIAVRLAADAGRLAQMRAGLRPRLAASALCDGRRTARYVERAFRSMWRTYCRRNAAPAYLFDNDLDYLAKLRDMVASGRVRIEFDPSRLKEMDSPVVVVAETERWAMGMVAVSGAVWWLLGTLAAAAAATLCAGAYFFLGRRNIARNIERRIHQKALNNATMWRALWRYGGISLQAAPDLVCAAPQGSWIRFIEQVMSRSK